MTPAQLMQEGRSFRETGPSLLRFGQCAAQEGDLARAERALAEASRVRASSVEQATIFPFDSILARFHLARVRERAGRREEARALYEQVVTHWGEADRPLPEVEEARRALARLASGAR